MTNQVKGGFTMEDNTQAVQALSKKDEAYVRIKDRIISPARASMYLSSDAGTLRKYMKSVPFLIRLFSCPS